MLQVKILYHQDIRRLEEVVNKWLSDNQHRIAIKPSQIQYQANNNVWSVMIPYI